MTLPNARQDTFGCQLANVADLGLTVVSTANVATQTSNNITDTNPRSIFVVCNMVSGTSLVIAGDIAAVGSTPAFSSPQDTYTITTSGRGFIKFNTTAASLNWAIKLTATGGPLVNQFAVLDLDKLGSGQEWMNMTSGQNATASLYNGPLTGSGVFPITV